ncbi:MAG: stage V sporulation protein AD [Firmicutes bacterium]|nr:stage V sporulation protein AD [Bacillota bacterium]
MDKRIGEQTVVFERPPVIISTASAAGEKEGEGPLKDYFDIVADDKNGRTSWEKAESKFIEDAIYKAVNKSGLALTDIDYILAGDLLNQTAATIFGVRELKRPFLGLYGACSTMGEALSLGAMLIDGGFAKKIVASASSHFCSAERQFRFPLGLGTQRPLSSTWTVTGCGAAVLSKEGIGPRIVSVTTGKMVDMGIKDANNMGAAMAPAAADTIKEHLKARKKRISDFDVVATGDLGFTGLKLAKSLLENDGISTDGFFTDCGVEIFDREKQDTHGGGSGCACSAITFCGYFYKLLMERKIKNILIVPTGALMSLTSSQQGESIPGIAHAVEIEMR